eukprot:2611687-Rhodomonas_salina.1
MGKSHKEFDESTLATAFRQCCKVCLVECQNCSVGVRSKCRSLQSHRLDCGCHLRPPPPAAGQHPNQRANQYHESTTGSQNTPRGQAGASAPCREARLRFCLGR